MAKLAWHAQRTTEAGKVWARVQGGKQVDGTELLALAPPGALTVFRKYFASYDFSGDPFEVAWRYVNAALSELGNFRRPGLIVQVINETHQRLGGPLELLAPVLQHLSNILHQLGLKHGGPGFSTGNPTAAEFEYLRARNWCGLDYLIMNEYWADLGFTQDHALRHRTLWQPGDPLVLVGECGRDATGEGPNGHLAGWIAQGVLGPQFLRECMDYDAELARDEYVKNAYVFTAGFHPPFGKFDIDTLCEQFAVDAVYVPEEEAPSMSVKDIVGEDKYNAWIAAGGNPEESAQRHFMATGALPVTEADWITQKDNVKSAIEEIALISRRLPKV